MFSSRFGQIDARWKFIGTNFRSICLEMVAHGSSRWWVAPGLNDFDAFLVKACQKRKLRQPDSVGDVKTFINNMMKGVEIGGTLLNDSHTIPIIVIT